MGADDSPVIYSTQHLTYDEEKGLAYLQEGFSVSRDSRTLTGQSLVFSTATRRAVARGDLLLDDPSMRMRGERVIMDFSTNIAEWPEGAKGEMKNSLWRFRAKNLKGNQDLYRAKRVRFTSCDHPHPDYQIRSWSGKIRPDSHIALTHAIFFIGPIPVFYWPYFTKSINPDRVRPTVYLDPGRSGREGKYVRSVIAYPLLRERLYMRMHLDYFSKIDMGYGPEILYRDTDRRRIAFYTYTIKEPSGLRQWDVRGDGYFDLGSGFSSQGTLRYQRDPNFNNFYSRENPERVTPDLYSSLALNWSRSYWTLRSVYDDRWGFDNVSGRFRSVERVYPSLEAIMSPVNMFGSAFYLSGNAAVRERRSRTSAAADAVIFDRWEDTGSLNLMRPWRLPFTRIISGSLGTGFSHYYVTDTSLTNQESFAQSRYNGTGSVLVSPGRLLNLTLSYTQGWRTEPNSLRQDTKAVDKGLDIKRLEGYNFSHLPLGGMMFMRSAYNFPRIPGTQLIDWTQNLEPVFGTLIGPLAKGSFGWTTGYEVFNRKYTHSVSLSQFLGPISLTTSGFYDNRKPNEVVPAIIGEFPLGRWFDSVQFTWRGLYTAKTEKLSGRVKKLDFFDKELVLMPHTHDFFIELIFRERMFVREFFFTIRLKTTENAQRRLRDKLDEQGFYPWMKR